MARYKVRVYEGTMWSLVTQADHFMDYNFVSDERLREFAQRLNREGFGTTDGTKWIMPASILTVERVDE